MNADARERIRRAQIKRWAALDASIAPLPKGKKRTARAANNWIWTFGSGIISANFVRTK